MNSQSRTFLVKQLRILQERNCTGLTLHVINSQKLFLNDIQIIVGVSSARVGYANHQININVKWSCSGVKSGTPYLKQPIAKCTSCSLKCRVTMKSDRQLSNKDNVSMSRLKNV